MVEVWLGAGALALVALAVVVAGALRQPRREPGDEAGALLADRRAEIAAEARVQDMRGDEVAALEQELALEFIGGTATDEDRAEPSAGEREGRAPRKQEPPATAARPPLLPLVGGCVAAVVLAIGLYALWGEPDGPTLAKATALMADDDATPEALADLARVLAARVARRPKDGDGWFYLGHLRMRSADYAGAAEAFAALHELTGGSEQIDLTWAQAGFLAAGGVLDEATLAIVERVLGRRPEHPNMLELLAMDAIRRSSFADAVGFLDRALRQPLMDSRRALLDETLALVRARLDAARPLIEVTVEVAGAPPPWLTVFARPVGGGMPRAVVRRPSRATQTLTLDDAVSMTAESPLSESGPLEVVAQLSDTGAAGDSVAQAVSAPVDPTAQPRVLLALGVASPGVSAGVAVHVATDAVLGPATPVFVIVRRPDVPGPPVAVRRLVVGDLPARITLTDDDAMLPGIRLSDLGALDVMARASLGGSPTSTSGDIESAVARTRLGAEAVALHIEHVVP
ncbi:MAG: hypothetical protein OXH15_14110 [Gammaproteobacteria bacterium]|nr:hypothetical protein [Gammaproteobacteria bacterium]